MKKILAICLILSVIAIFISGCEQKDKTTSSVIAVGESDVTTSQTETSSRKSSKPIIDRTDKTSSEESSLEEKNSSVPNKEDVKYINTNSGEIRLAPANATYPSVITNIYENEELMKISESVGESINTIGELNSLYPIEFIREHEDGYKVLYISAEYTFGIIFDKNQRVISGGGGRRSKYTKQEFEQLSLGDTEERVMSLFPNDGAHARSGSVSLWFWSNYYTSDGYEVDIDYVYTGTESYTGFPPRDKLAISEITITIQ